ncbi:VOC family protein [Hymenobacter sp. HMF4947]|uniref:VOC family protein n=1 Tax=Hymenobacter ginkgonis TaxID=2682976 RepID=A0A7K1TGN8_9BACT|nr:VOC family protein [Hymenobacter ginkgonis]MVN77575.1 VOC family protein [Hymenobacter ginkgonis]
MLHCTPFLLFDGNCAEAMTFYHQCLGGELTLTKLGDTPMKDQFPVEKHGRIINARLTSGLIDLSATDWMAAPNVEPRPGNTVSLFIVGQTYAEVKAVFEQLAEGADPDPCTLLHPMPFGSYGQFTDRYGVAWVFKSDNPA